MSFQSMHTAIKRQSIATVSLLQTQFIERDSIVAIVFLRIHSCCSPSENSPLYLRAASLYQSSCNQYYYTVILLAFMHAAAYAITRGRYNSSFSNYIATYYLVFENSVARRLYSILSAVSSVNCDGLSSPSQFRWRRPSYVSTTQQYQHALISCASPFGAVGALQLRAQSNRARPVTLAYTTL